MPKIKYLQDSRFDEKDYLELNQRRKQQSRNQLMAKTNENLLCKKLLQSNKQLNLRKKKSSPVELKDLVTKAKVEILTRNFLRKLRRGMVYSEAPTHPTFDIDQEGFSAYQLVLEYLSNTEGLELSPVMMCFWSLINVLQLTIIAIIFSLIIAFPQTRDLESFFIARVFSVVLYICDMALNFVTVKHGICTYNNLRDIIRNYLTNEFGPDFFSIIMFPISYSFENNGWLTPLILCICLVKLKNNLKRFESYEYIYVKSSSREQYYSLFKVFLLNFTIGHVLSIILNLMATLSQESQPNWYSKVSIEHGSWTTKYVWGYYWGANIMLTVGFGDLNAANQVEAILLIFIQTMSCITLAYNISCVGSIIGSMKEESEEKKKKLKYFHKMSTENDISEELTQRINNFIEESYLIKEEFEIDQEEEVIQSLPQKIQSEYRREANTSLFQVGLFKSLNSKTISNLAEKIERKVAHPQELLQKKGEVEQFYILQKGCIAFTCKNGPKSTLNGKVIEKFELAEGQTSKILSLGFIKQKILAYDVKSLVYSIIYSLDFGQFIRIVKDCEMDCHFFHYIKDKDQNILGSNDIQLCSVCSNEYHTLFECPKHHYIPLKENVIRRSLLIEKEKRNDRRNHERGYKDFSRVLHCAKGVQKAYIKYIESNFDSDEIKQIQNLRKYFYQKKEKQLHENLSIVQDSQNEEINNHFNKIEDMLKAAVFHEQKDFWLIESDAATNFRYYFKEFNSSRLKNFRMNQMKRKRNDIIFGTSAWKLPQNAQSSLKRPKDSNSAKNHLSLKSYRSFFDYF